MFPGSLILLSRAHVCLLICPHRQRARSLPALVAEAPAPGWPPPESSPHERRVLPSRACLWERRRPPASCRSAARSETTARRASGRRRLAEAPQELRRPPADRWRSGHGRGSCSGRSGGGRAVLAAGGGGRPAVLRGCLVGGDERDGADEHGTRSQQRDPIDSFG